MNTQELLNLKEQIEKSKEIKSKLEGAKESLLKLLKEDWNCENVDVAKEKAENLVEDIEKLERKIEKHTKELEDQLNEQNSTASE